MVAAGVGDCSSSYFFLCLLWADATNMGFWSQMTCDLIVQRNADKCVSISKILQILRVFLRLHVANFLKCTYWSSRSKIFIKVNHCRKLHHQCLCTFSENLSSVIVHIMLDLLVP